MAKLRRKTTSASGRVPSPDVVLSMRIVMDATQAELVAMSDDERAVWRELRSKAADACYMNRFDPRCVPLEDAAARALWDAEREAWLRAEIFADDPRVQ